MKFTQHHALGNPADVLTLESASHQSLEPNEVRVDVLATPIHPSNLLQIAGQYGVSPALPSTPGSEGVGRVVEVGSNVNQLAVGQLALLVGGGTWRQQIVGPVTNFIPLPEGGDVEQLSMLTVNPLTAQLILTSFVDLQPGDWIMQSAANSAVGEFIIQLAKAKGIKTVNVVRRESLVEDLTDLGADVVLIDGPELNEQIASATGGAAISLAIDAVGGETFTRLLQGLTYGGTLVSYGALSMQPPVINPGLIIFNDIRVRGFWLAKWFETATMEQKQSSIGHMVKLIITGAIKAKVDSRFSLEDIKQAVTRAAEQGRNGKVLLIPKR